MSDKKFVSLYLDKDVADKVEIIRNEVEAGNVKKIDEMIKHMKNEGKWHNEGLEEDILRFKLANEKLRRELKVSYDSQIEQAEKYFAEYDTKVLSRVNTLRKKVEAQCEAINEAIAKTARKSQETNVPYKFETLLKTLSKVAEMTESERVMAEKLLKAMEKED